MSQQPLSVASKPARGAASQKALKKDAEIVLVETHVSETETAAKKRTTAAKRPVAAPPVPKSPVAQDSAGQPEKPAAPPRKGGRVAKATPIVEDPSAIEGAVAEVAPRRRVTAPMSPRSAAAVFTAPRKNAVPLTASDAKRHTILLSRSVGRYAQITGGVLKSKNGEYSVGGKVYTQADLKEMTKDISKAIERLPGVFRASNARRKEVLSEEERDARRTALLAKAREGAELLAEIIDIPRLADVLYEKARVEIDAKKRLSRPESSKQITSQFYVTDRFVDFVRSGNFGNGLALLFPGVSPETHAIPCANDQRTGDTKKRDEAIAAVERECAEILGGKSLAEFLETDTAKLYKLADPRSLLLLLLNNNVASSPLLMTIMTRYNKVNGLTDPATKRIHVDKNMSKHFGPGTDSRWMLKGADFTPTDAQVSAVEDQAERDRLQTIVDNSKLSVFEQLQNYTPKRKAADAAPRSSDEPMFDGETYERSLAIVIASKCHIGSVPERQEVKLRDPRIAALTAGLNIYI